MAVRSHRYVQFAGQYEPEGIHLTAPLEGEQLEVLQGWGEFPAYHAQFTYNGVPLKGHPGVDLVGAPGAAVLAVEPGRVVEISSDPGGLGRYVKIEHRWGESLYAQVGAIQVESGQTVTRGQSIAQLDSGRRPFPCHLHFAIRIQPYHRFDGWGGFSDPTPFLYVIAFMEKEEDATLAQANDGIPFPPSLPPMLAEYPGMRRP